MKTKINKFVLLFTALLLLGAFFVSRVKVRTMYDGFSKPELPEAREFQFSTDKLQVELEEEFDGLQENAEDDIDTGVDNPSDSDTDGDDKIVAVESTLPYNEINDAPLSSLPVEYNLAVPFQSQAPFKNWDMPYQEACEEASLIMADAFFYKREITPDIMDRKIQDLVDWQLKRFGYYKDTTSKEVVEIAQEYFGLNAFIDEDVSIENIKQILSQNKLILVPAAGRILPNPNFTGEGPLYHMLVIRGYTDKYFITNDPGTRNGEEFLYKYNDLINAIHDWPSEKGGNKDDVSDGDILTGKRVMIVVNRNNE